jgi:hypothetical protein
MSVFDVDGTATHGTLRVPAHRENQRLAAALLRPGAGTTGPGLKVLTGVNHDLHMPGTADNDPVLAASVVSALEAWAQPFAATG